MVVYNIFRIFQILKEYLYYDYTLGNSIRGWPLMEHFNNFVLEVVQHGLFDKWERVIVDKYLNFKVQLGLKLTKSHHKLQSKGPTKLNVSHLTGAMYVWSFGLGISIVTLLIEIIYFKYFKSSNLHGID